MDFSNAGAGIDLRFANFSNANLAGTDFGSSDLSHANLEGATGGPNYTGVIWNNTICPDGTNSDQYIGNGCVGTFQDADGDGVTDSLDGFVNNNAASLDSDSDGYPDEWNDTCDASCQGSSGFSNR